MDVGRTLLVVGLVLAAVGALVMVVGRLGLPLGRLPGDIVVKREGFTLYLPIATSILVSVVVSLLALFFRR